MKHLSGAPFCGQYYKLFTAVITPLAAYFSMILTELRQQRRNYACKKFYNIDHWGRLQTLPARFGSKCLPGTNALAYYEH